MGVAIGDGLVQCILLYIHKSKADKIGDRFSAIFNTSDYLLVCSCLVPINWFQYVTCSSVNCSDLISWAKVTARLCRDI